jgi:hypothetical protein
VGIREENHRRKTVVKALAVDEEAGADTSFERIFDSCYPPTTFQRGPEPHEAFKAFRC